MIIRNLCVTYGGGIENQLHRVEQSKDVNIYIGLGGFGIDCLSAVKKEVYSSVTPDEESLHNRYSRIRFLAIDSEDSYVRKSNEYSIYGIDRITEFFNIGCLNLGNLMESMPSVKPPHLDWLSDEIPIINDDPGVAHVRQIGRLLLFLRINELRTLIKKLIHESLEKTDTPNHIHIHIFTSLCGSTGSGIFLDVCYLIRNLLNEIAPKTYACLHGYFFLPDIFSERIQSVAVKNYFAAVGYAVLKELNYCMNFPSNGDKWQQDYGEFFIECNRSPVDIPYLISSKDIHNNLRTNGLNYALNVVADYAFEYAIYSDPFYRKTFPVDLLPIAKSQKEKDQGYIIMGASCATLSNKQIITYLVAKILDKLNDMPKDNHDIEKFVADNGLKYEDILKQVRKDAITIPLFEVDARLLKEQCQGLTAGEFPQVPQVTCKMINVLSVIEDTLEKNRKYLSQTLIEGVYQKLLQYCTTFDKGPFYASLMLHSNNMNDRDFENIIAGYIEQNDSNLAYARADLELRINSVAAALREVQNRRPNSRRAQKYILEVHSYFLTLAKTKLYSKMDNLLHELKLQISKLYTERFAPMINMLNDVSETFKINYLALSEYTTRNADCAVKILDLDNDELRNHLDLYVSQLDTESIIIDFIDNLLTPDHAKSWLGRKNDVELSNVVSEFFLGALGHISYINIDEVLAKKYKLNIPNLLAKEVFSDLLCYMKRSSMPLFSISPSSPDTNTISVYAFPEESDILYETSKKVHEMDSSCTIRKSELYRVLFRTFGYVSAKQYALIERFKQIYEAHFYHGIHIYEGKKELNNSKNYRDLPELLTE